MNAGISQFGLVGYKQPEFSDYRIGLMRDVSLDITSGTDDVSKYRATLGHKACHSFTPNAHFAREGTKRLPGHDT